MIDRAAIRRILLVSLDNLGDLVFASALTPPLQAAFPHAVIDVWCKHYTAPIAPLIPHVREVIAADPFWADSPGRPRAPMLPFLRSIGEVRQRRYDVALLSQAPWRCAAAVNAASIPARIGFARRHNARFLTDVVSPEDPAKPVLAEQARLLAPLGIEPAPLRYRLETGPLDERRRALAEQLPARFVAVHPFAGARDRCVPLTEWTQLAFALEARRIQVLWVGTTTELNELRLSHTHPKGAYVDQLADASLLTTAAALSLARAFVGHDSGPLHVGGALNVPVLGIFAPGQPARTFPQGAGPWRMIARPGRNDIDAGSMLRELEALGLFSVA
jgi:ADP-heptose:LPS heptosyltransferase